ncbi:MAG: hypothetical protein L0Y55_21065 [Anaerolineales bacterium]|nr:hypothetical protein [Anaerolineales bacterium]
MIFRLRGKSKTEIMEMLRARRAAETLTAPQEQPVGKKKARVEKTPPEKSVPLEKFVSAFWTADDTLDDFRVNVRAAEIDTAAVKRLGAPGFWRGKQDFAALMERAYREAARTALALVRE